MYLLQDVTKHMMIRGPFKAQVPANGAKISYACRSHYFKAYTNVPLIDIIITPVSQYSLVSTPYHYIILHVVI